MKSQSIIKHGEPLQELLTDDPLPQGSEVLIRCSHCGVCHSDVHLHDGYFDLGNDRKLDVTASHALPFTLGHEIVGEIAAVGPGVSGAAVGDRAVVYPWIGCGGCPVCQRGDEHLCNKSRALGVNLPGGYADHVLVPDSRYLFDYGAVDSHLAGLYMCSGLTAYSALKKAGSLGEADTLAIVGLGGVGMMGLEFAKLLYPHSALAVADIDDGKLDVARRGGAARAYNSAAQGSWKSLLKESGGGAQVAIDFVGSEASLDFAQRSVCKGGRVIVVGLFGGQFALPIPMFPLRELTISGSYVGSLADAREMMALVRGGKVAPIPVDRRALSGASQALDDLRQGKVTGRVVLDCH